MQNMDYIKEKYMVNMKNKNCCEKDCNCDCCDEGEKENVS